MITHIKKTKTEGIASQNTVQEFFQWDDFHYGNLKYETGLKLLDKIYHNNPEAKDKHERSKMFWRWFHSQWFLGEQTFLKLLRGWIRKGLTEQQIESKYHELMYFNCVSSNYAYESFNNYLKISQRNGKH